MSLPVFQMGSVTKLTDTAVDFRVPFGVIGDDEGQSRRAPPPGLPGSSRS